MPAVPSWTAIKDGVPSRPASAVTTPLTATIEPIGRCLASAIETKLPIDGVGEALAAEVGAGVGVAVGDGDGTGAAEGVGVDDGPGSAGGLGWALTLGPGLRGVPLNLPV